MASARAYREQATAPFDWDQEMVANRGMCNTEYRTRNTGHQSRDLAHIGRAKTSARPRFCNLVRRSRAGFEPRVDRPFPDDLPFELVTQKRYHTADPQWLKPGATDQKGLQRLSARRGFRPTIMGKSTIQSESIPGNNLMSSARIALKLTFSWASAVIRSTCRA